jgi:hypothetical protein
MPGELGGGEATVGGCGARAGVDKAIEVSATDMSVGRMIADVSIRGGGGGAGGGVVVEVAVWMSRDR